MIGSGDLETRIDLRGGFGGEREGRAGSRHTGDRVERSCLLTLNGVGIDGYEVIGGSLQGVAWIQDHTVAHKLNRATVGGCVRTTSGMGKGFYQHTHASVFQIHPEPGSIITGDNVFREGQHQVVVLTHCGNVVHRVTAWHRE